MTIWRLNSRFNCSEYCISFTHKKISSSFGRYFFVYTKFQLIDKYHILIDQHASLWEKFLKKGFWLYLFSFIIAPIGYIVKIILSGNLSVWDIWLIYGIISLITLLSSFSDFGIRESLLFYLPKYYNKKEFARIKSLLLLAFIIQWFTSITLACIFFFWSEILWEHYFENNISWQIIKVFSMFFLWINTFQLINNFFLSVQNTFLQKSMEFVRSCFILFSVIIILFFSEWTIIQFSYAWIIWLYIWLLLSWIIFYHKYYKIYLKSERIMIDFDEFKNIFIYAFIVFLWAQASTILSQIDMQMIIVLLGTESAWYYTNYLSIIGIPFILIAPIFAFLLPVFSELYSKNKESRDIIKIKKNLQDFTCSLWISLNIFFFVFATYIAYVLFWENFLLSWEILKYSILLLTFNFLLQINFNILATIWKIKNRLYIIIFTIFINVIGNYILIQYLWVYGAAIMTWLSWIIMWVLSEIYVWEKMRVWLNYSSLGKHIWLFWILWFLIHLFIIPYLLLENRLIVFLFISWIWLIWFWIYFFLNKKIILSLTKK